MTPQQEREAVDTFVAYVRGEFQAGARQVGFSADAIVAMLAAGPLALLPVVGSYLTDLFTSAEQLRLEASMKSLAGDVERWATIQRADAERGKRDDGSDYGWDRWIARARELLTDLKSFTGYAWADSVVVNFAKDVVVKSVAEVGGAVATAVQPWTWSTKAKLAAGAVGVVVVLAVLSPYLQPILKRA